MTTADRIALLPLDDRPVNVALPRDVAEIAGARLDLPPRELLPDYRRAGAPDGLAAWLTERAADPETSQLVVSLDMLLYGGLIASRIGHDSTPTVLRRLELLRELRERRPDMRILAVSLVMRASDSYSASEEPEYWTRYGREIHRLGGDLHRRFVAADGGREAETSVPDDVVGDFASRRLRNHIVNLAAIGLVQGGVIDVLTITADDTAAFAAGSVEQLWLQHWLRFLPAGNRVLMYPGADEVGAALVARAVAADTAQPVAIRVVCPDPEGLERIPPYENRPLRESIAGQIAATGARSVDSDAADVVLIVHAPDPERHDMHTGPAVADLVAVDRTLRAVRDAIDAGARVALADVRYPNGADRVLVDALLADGTFGQLVAFGAWNTAGNTLGGVLATVVATVIGMRNGTFNAVAARQALLTRALDDWGYQSVVRNEDGPSLFPDRMPLQDPQAVAAAESVIADRLRMLLADRLRASDQVLERVELPWRRAFEVGLTLRSA